MSRAPARLRRGRPNKRDCLSEINSFERMGDRTDVLHAKGMACGFENLVFTMEEAAGRLIDEDSQADALSLIWRARGLYNRIFVLDMDKSEAKPLFDDAMRNMRLALDVVYIPRKGGVRNG